MAECNESTQLDSIEVPDNIPEPLRAAYREIYRTKEDLDMEAQRLSALDEKNKLDNARHAEINNIRTVFWLFIQAVAEGLGSNDDIYIQSILDSELPRAREILADSSFAGKSKPFYT